MQETFTKEIVFLSKTLSDGLDGTQPELVEKLVTKVATFRELQRTAKDQHKLHFKIVSLFSDIETVEPEEGTVVDNGKDQKIILNTDKVYDLTLKCIRTLLLIDNDFTAQDREEFLQDSGALFNFGVWLLGEKITPFFSEMRKTV